MNIQGNNIFKVLGIVGFVVIAVAVGFVLFSCNNVVKDSKIAVNYAKLTAGDDYTYFDKNVTNAYSTTPPSDLQTYIESLQTTAPTLYTRYIMATLSYTAQWSITQNLINQTAFGGKRIDIDYIASMLDSYLDKMQSTIEAIRIFNLDKQTGGVNDTALQNECVLIIKRLDMQVGDLLNLNKRLLDCVASSNFDTPTQARGDLRIALANGLYRQGVVLANATSAYIKDQTIQNQNDKVIANATITLNAFRYAANRKFVYADINTTNGSEVEDFLATYKSVAKADEMLSKVDPVDYINKTTDTNLKAKLTSIWTFFTKLANGGV